MSRSPRRECANDPSRRREAQIPDGIQFKSKVDLALDAIERAAADNVPGQLVLAEADTRLRCPEIRIRRQLAEA
ncbi:hypothetical protein WME76_25435 [Sorangium sp. So ce119]|uniref:hypothetical protein n=1 Tax=Sorangium sp. So ce119 TaxID=3133279 RepID=UPI003F62D8EC